VLEIAAVTAARGDEAGEYAELRHVILDRNDEVVQALDLAVTPSAVIITTNNEIGSGVAEGAIEIGNLLTEVALDGRAVLERGDPVGATILPSHGGILCMADLAGSMTLLTFWDPWCGYCQAFLPELRAREMGLGSSQRLVVAVQGTPEVAEVLGFETSAHDTDGSVMRRFGGYGTPSAVLVDAAGRVCSEIAHGRDEIIALADRSDHLSALAAATS